jgi:LysM repeat protein
VLAKETKYSIAKRYGITVEELEKRNPEVVDNLPIGYRLTIGVAPRSEKSNRNN